MRKTLKDLTLYLESIVVRETKDEYEVNEIFNDVATSYDIHQGVIDFRFFLISLYKTLYDNADKYDVFKKVAHEYENRTTLSGYYPFLNNIKNILIKLGFYGVFSKDYSIISCNNRVFDEKVSKAKTLECLVFLDLCGLKINDIDLTDKKQDFTKIDNITFSSSKDCKMLLGLKVMAISEIKLGTLSNQDILMRCDYRTIKKNPDDVFSILNDSIVGLPTDIKDFIIKLHHRYMDKGFKCDVEIKGYYIYIKYIYKRTEIFGFNNSLANGYHINVKARNMSKYHNIVNNLPYFLQEVIKNGFGCGRKNEVGHCNGGCRGMIIPLDDNVLSLQEGIFNWIDNEIKY